MDTLRAGRTALIRIATLAVAVAAGASEVGCATASKAPSERLPDGSHRLDCKTSLARCLERAEQICLGNRFTVLGAVDQRDYQSGQGMEVVETRSSRAVVKCGARGRSFFGGNEDPLPTLATPIKEGDTAASPASAPAATSAPRACVPGTTQACTGPAACTGGQACLRDGSGFAACDCGGGPAGNAAPPVAAPAVPGSTPAP